MITISMIIQINGPIFTLYTARVKIPAAKNYLRVQRTAHFFQSVTYW
jgi:hypothetical protein